MNSSTQSRATNNMKRQAHYPDLDTVPYANNAQLHQMSVQRMQLESGINTPMGRAVPIPAEHDHYYVSPFQLDANARNRSTVLPHPYHETPGPLNRQQLSDSSTGLQNAVHVDRPESHEQDMEIGYEDNPAPPTFEALEKKFQDETLKLLKEKVDTEDAEIIRHKEKIIEISNQYQEKLSILRAQQASQREEFLPKESEARLRAHQQSVTSYLPGKVGLIDDHGYIAEPTVYLARNVGSMHGSGYVNEPNGPVDGRGYVNEPNVPVNGRGYVNEPNAPVDARGYVTEPNGPVDGRGYASEPNGHMDGRGYVTKPNGPVDGRGYVTEPNGPDGYRTYSTTEFHDQTNRPAIHATDKRQRTASGRVPMPPGRVYNNSGAGI